jgi:predicted secreted protein
MTTAAIAGVGTSFKRGNGGSPETFASVAEVNSISGPGMTRGQIDVTSLDSTGGYKEYIAGFRDGGEISLNMNFTRDGYIALMADFESDSARNYQIVLPDTGATTIDFAGLVMGIPLDIPTDGKITCTCTIKLTGAPTISS